MPNLTKKQKKVFDFIHSYIAENGISPTIEEVRKKLKLKAVSTVHEHINSLIEKGYLSKSDNSARSLTLKKEIKSVIEIPILGSIKAGFPLPAIQERDGYVSVVGPQIKTADGLYALRVVGDSMIDDGIFDGDIVVIKHQSVAENGQTVVAIIDDNEATLKRLYRKGKGFELVPRNPNMQTLFRTDVEVRGVVVQVISSPANRPVQEDKKGSTKYGFRTIDLFAGGACPDPALPH
jgi:SOS regulatory protein LexA